jgi:DNA repair exonuclease SbcCD ATPase subunit
MDEVKAMLREILETLRQNQRADRRQLDEIESSVAAVARSFEQEDRLQERQERAEAREREQAAAELADIKQRVENFGMSMRDMPEKCLAAIEKRIDDYRRAKYEASLVTPSAGAYSMQLREPSTKIAVARRDVDDITGVFDRTHTDGERRAVKEFVGGIALHAWKRGGKWVAATVSGGGLYHLLHKLGIL